MKLSISWTFLTVAVCASWSAVFLPEVVAGYVANGALVALHAGIVFRKWDL